MGIISCLKELDKFLFGLISPTILLYIIIKYIVFITLVFILVKNFLRTPKKIFNLSYLKNSLIYEMMLNIYLKNFLTYEN